MRRLAYGVATLAVMGAAASAADLPVKAPPYTAPPAPLGYDWSGFYVGANAGYGVGRDPAGETKTTMLIGGLPASAITNEQFMLSPAGALGGVQLGYNWQIAPHWVAGLEGDWDASGQRDSVCIAQCTDFGAGTPVGLTVEQKISWLATTRARLGYAQGGWLAYLTGGGAFGHVTDNVTATFTSFGPPTVHTGAASFSRTLGGWVIGAGVETAIAGHWTGKLEYLYADLGSTSDGLAPIPFVQGVAGVQTQSVSSEVRDHIVRIGVNYRFGGSTAEAALGPAPGGIYKAPVAAPAYVWTGFYVGANAGYGLGRDKSSDVFAAPAFPDATESFTVSPAGPLAGGQIGYNWQPAAHALIGLEADWQWSDQTGSVCVSDCIFAPVAFPQALTVAQDIKSIATLRGRLGYADDGWLWYVTGGAAWGRVSETDTLLFSPGFGRTSTVAGTFDRTKGGWTLGAGVETAICGAWTTKLEYLYVDLGSTTNTMALSAADSLAFFGGPGGAQSVTSALHDHIVRVGLNYRFGAGAVAAPY